MSDLIERLREVGGMSDDGATRWYINPDGPEAADRIEKLEELVKRLRDDNSSLIDDFDKDFLRQETRIEKLEAALHSCFHRIEELQAALRKIALVARKALEGKDDV